jgi:hypothetical protein
VTFFFDNCLPKRVVEALRALGVDAIHLREKYDGAIKDIDWMPLVANEGWIAVTDDHRIIKNPAERKLRADLKLRTVFLPKGLPSMGFWEQAAWIVKHWEKIEAKAIRLRAGECMIVKMQGNIDKSEG